MRLSQRLVQVSWWERLVPAHWWVELGMPLWWPGPCQGVSLVGSYMLRKTLSSLAADGWGCVPALLGVWTEESQHWSLQPVGWGQVLVRKWWPPQGLTPMSTPQNYPCQCPCPYSEPQPPLPLQETLHHQQVGLAQALMRPLLFSLGPGVHKTLCVCVLSKSGVSVSPSPVESL